MPHTSARNVLVSTTPDLEGWKVKSYLDVVSSHVVAGTNMFSDIAASFSDVFGGRSKSYKRQLESIKEEAISELKDEASQLGADAIIGVKIDHDQISGQNKGMLMVTASGTAVTAERVDADDVTKDKEAQTGPLSARELEIEVRKKEILQGVRNGDMTLDEDVWDFLIENQVEEIGKNIRVTLEKILERGAHRQGQKRHKEQSRKYFLSLPEGPAKDQLYEMVLNRDLRIVSWAVQRIEEANLLDLDRVEAMLDDSKFLANKRALPIVAKADKPNYTQKDIQRLQRIRQRISKGFDKRGKVREVEESGMLSSEEKKVWEIEEGVHNEMDREYCRKTGLNIFGFKKDETKPDEALEATGRKLNVLVEQFGGSGGDGEWMSSQSVYDSK